MSRSRIAVVVCVALLAILSATILVTSREAARHRGLTGRYYSGTSWHDGEFLLSTTDDAISTATLQKRAPSFRAQQFSVIWTGYLLVDVSTQWTFATRSDDGSFLDIDGQTVVDNGGEHASRTAYGVIWLSKGWHRVQVRYVQAGGGMDLGCAWAVPGRGGSSERRPRCLIAGVTLTTAAETPFMRPIVGGATCPSDKPA
jgi:PA14 domain